MDRRALTHSSAGVSVTLMNHQYLSVLFGLGLVACASEGAKEPSPGAESSASPSNTTAATTSGGTTNPTPPTTSSTSVPTAAASSTTPGSDAEASTGFEPGAQSEVATVPSHEANGSTEAALESSTGGDASTTDADLTSAPDATAYAAGFHELFIHDECTDNNPTEDVCAHARVHEVTFTFGGDPLVTYDVTLRVRGLFEPTTIAGGATPDPSHPYFKVGGTVTKADYSQWQIRIAEPEAIFYLNHYPETGHIIYAEDFEVTIPVRGASPVVVSVVDGNDRQIDNGYVGLPDRQQSIAGVTEGAPDGQVLRLDVIAVTEAQ